MDHVHVHSSIVIHTLLYVTRAVPAQGTEIVRF